MKQMEADLVHDLQYICTNLKGEYKLSRGAYEWGKQWYDHHQKHKPLHLDDERFGGYLSRKQSHMHKLAIILAASSSDELIITEEHLSVASVMVTDLEKDMDLVFSKIGKSATSTSADRLVAYVHKRGEAPFLEVYRYMHSLFPSMRDYDDILAGVVKAGYVRLVNKSAEGSWLVAGEPQGKK
jgi:hypothetical protein